jgi:Holliday junction resolvasome RuvABC endonuclease subunit
MKRTIRILGLDPGLTALGWIRCRWDGEVLSPVSADTFVTKPTQKKQRSIRQVDDNQRRFREQARELKDLLLSEDLRTGPVGVQLVCMEALCLGTKGKRSDAAKQGGSTATIIAVCEVLGKPLLQATPQEIKKEVTGGVKASKEEVQQTLKAKYSSFARLISGMGKGKREHLTDAFGAVIACLNTEEARMCLL